MRRRILFYSVTLILVACLVEAGAYVFSLASPQIYSHEARAQKQLQDGLGNYAAFLSTSYDGVTGWKNPVSGSRRQNACGGSERMYYYDGAGARIRQNSSIPPEFVRVVLVGDSYTHGSQVEYEDAFPTRLATLLDASVANQGVAGFGPLQSVLRYEQVAPRYPNARIAVLGIMYENIRRLPNSYRPVYQKKSNVIFGFKPFVDFQNGKPVIRQNPNGVEPKDGTRLGSLVRQVFDSDYWVKPVARFPYSVSLVRGILSDNALKIRLGNLGARLGLARYHFDYSDRDLSLGMEMVIRRFVDSAWANRMQPVVLFIPGGEDDLSSPAQLTKALQEKLVDRAVVMDVGAAAIDWGNYGQEIGCHPTPQGYADIAETLYDGLLQAGLWVNSTSGDKQE